MVTAPGRRYARKAPSRIDKTRSVDIRVTDMVAHDAAWWDGPRRWRQCLTHVAREAPLCRRIVSRVVGL
jgi:hypothetical protein